MDSDHPRTPSNDKPVCQHIFPGKSDVIKGTKSTLAYMESRDKFIVCVCRICKASVSFARRHEPARIKSLRAEGLREEHSNQFAADLIQPTNERGEENRKFTEKYGYNPHAPAYSGKQQRPDDPNASPGNGNKSGGTTTNGLSAGDA